MVGRFDSKIALVTGAGQGVGRATALRMAREGAVVIVCDRTEESALKVVNEIREFEQQAYTAIHDLSNYEEVREMVNQIKRNHGRLDIAIHNVGGTIWCKPFIEYEPSEMMSEINQSLWPTLWCCHAVVPLMLEAGSGSIVNIGSIATRGIHRVPYSGAKGAVAAISRTIAEEVSSKGIRVNCIAPGGVDVSDRITPRNANSLSSTDLVYLDAVKEQTLHDTPMKRFGTPEEVASAICYVASDEASYITGQTIYVSGGAIG